jgi:hypothetical protein
MSEVPREIVLIVRGRVAQLGCFAAGLTHRGAAAAVRGGEDVEMFVLGPAGDRVPGGIFLAGEKPHYTTLEALRGEDSGPMVDCIQGEPIVRPPARKVAADDPARTRADRGAGPIVVLPNSGKTRLLKDPGCAACRGRLRGAAEYAERTHRFRTPDGIGVSFFYYCVGCAPAA